MAIELEIVEVDLGVGADAQGQSNVAYDSAIAVESTGCTPRPEGSVHSMHLSLPVFLACHITISSSVESLARQARGA